MLILKYLDWDIHGGAQPGPDQRLQQSLAFKYLPIFSDSDKVCPEVLWKWEAWRDRETWKTSMKGCSAYS